MSVASDALGDAIDTAIAALSGTDQAVAQLCWRALAGPVLAAIPGYTSAPTSTPTWIKITKSYSAFADPSTNKDIDLYTLPPGGVIHAVKLKHSQNFAGGGINLYEITVGIVGDLSKYAGAFDVFQGVSNTALQLLTVVGTENHGASTSIRMAATCNGANLNQALQGSVDAWLLVSVAV